jgi:hypothetical protein
MSLDVAKDDLRLVAGDGQAEHRGALARAQSGEIANDGHVAGQAGGDAVFARTAAGDAVKLVHRARRRPAITCDGVEDAELGRGEWLRKGCLQRRPPSVPARTGEAWPKQVGVVEEDDRTDRRLGWADRSICA